MVHSPRMDIERLSKVQIVLLTLLVSFVTSIATGIVTVSLMGQAPPSVAQTVNHVIERTVQAVVPASQTSATAEPQQTKAVVTGADIIAQSVQKASPSIVRIYTSDPQSPTFLGLGVVLDGSGTIASDLSALGQSQDAVALLFGGSHVRVSVTTRNSSTGVVLLASATSTIEGAAPTWTPATIAGSKLFLGDTATMLSGSSVARIGSGIVTSLFPPTKDMPEIIDTSIDPNAVLPGAPLIDAQGEVVGMSTAVSRSVSDVGFVPASAFTPQAAATQSK